MTIPHRGDPDSIAENLIPRIDRALTVLKSLTYSASAVPRYDLLSDAIYWEDESPKPMNDDVRAIIRHILRTRIELAQHGGNDPTWNYLKKKVPTWPGFRQERNGQELLSLYAQGRTDMHLADE